MRTVAIIQARMNSTRFPGKVLADLCGKPVLKHVIDRVRMCRLVDEVAVALSRQDDWEPIAGRCEDWGVSCHAFNVPADDVLSRYVRACNHWNAEICVRVCGDNPLVMTDDLDKLINGSVIIDNRLIGYSDIDGRPLIRRSTGYFGESMSAAVLHLMNDEIDPGDVRREHVTAAIYDQGPFELWPAPSWYTTLNPPNAAIDTPEDLERVAEMLNVKGESNGR